MEDILKTNERIFLVFTVDSAEKRWWLPFLKKPFHHVFAVLTWTQY